MNTRILSPLLPIILSLAISAPAFGFEEDSFLSRVKWKARFGVSDFHVYDTNTFGVGIGIKGNYATADGTQLELLLTVTADFDREELD